MPAQDAYYLHRLKEDLSLKQRNNPHYSLRAFARDIDLHPGTLSGIFQGKRSLPLKSAPKVISKLQLSAEERTRFMESLLRKKLSIDDIQIYEDDRFILDESYYKVIAEWEHYALLELFNLDQFIPSTTEIAERLDLTLNRTQVVINNLLQCGLLVPDEKDILVRAFPDIRTTEDIASDALKSSHLETLELGKEKLELDIALRDFSSSTFAIDLADIPKAKTIIREFRQKMTKLLSDGANKTDVYQIAVQFYPLTTPKDPQEH